MPSSYFAIISSRMISRASRKDRSKELTSNSSTISEAVSFFLATSFSLDLQVAVVDGNVELFFRESGYGQLQDEKRPFFPHVDRRHAVALFAGDVEGRSAQEMVVVDNRTIAVADPVKGVVPTTVALHMS